mgnify:CR=1 FL=1
MHSKTTTLGFVKPLDTGMVQRISTLFVYAHSSEKKL